MALPCHLSTAHGVSVDISSYWVEQGSLIPLCSGNSLDNNYVKKDAESIKDVMTPL